MATRAPGPAESGKRAQDYGGYDCEVVQCPPDSQTECSICLLVLYKPYLTSCCGHNFCRSCIECVKKDRGLCPLCNEPNFTLMHNKGLERSLMELSVRCTHHKLGCHWIGKLCTLNKHLNLNPTPEQQLKGCKYTDVKCVFGCLGYFKRGVITEHQANECPNKPAPLDSHAEHVCLLAAMNEEMTKQIAQIESKQETTEQALREVVAHSKRENEMLKQEIAECRRENMVLRQEIEGLKRSQQGGRSLVPLYTHIGIVPVHFVLPDFTILKYDGDDWNSEPFYTHPQGYKMSLRVQPDGGSRRATWVSLYIHLMRGEFDNSLNWPFQGTVTIMLLNQLADSEHYVMRYVFDEVSGRRVVGGEYTSGWGWSQFINDYELEYNSAKNCQYLKYGILRFKVSRVQF